MEAKMTKAMQRALVDLARAKVLPSTSDVFRDLVKGGYAESLGLIVASRGRRGVTFKAGFKITPLGARVAQDLQGAIV
jgi:hypothetical protein